MMRARSFLVAWLVAGMALLLGAPAAHAACHIAGFVETDVRVDEDAGRVRLRVELQGRQPTCSGTVSYETRERSAESPQDFEARSGELSFSAGDDRVERITIPIVDDQDPEDTERFEVHLTDTSGTITGISSSANPAVVTIRDDDEEPSPEPTEEESPEESSPSPEPTEDSPSPTETATPTPDDTDEPIAGAPTGADDGGVSGGVIAGIIVGAIAIAGGIGAWLWRKTSPTP